MSEMVGSLSSGSSGPRPKISSRISRASRSRSAKLRGTASLFTVLRISSRTSSRAASFGVRPSFSKSRRSRILRWRSALTCWYSVLSKACRFAMGYLTNLKQRPGRTLHRRIILGQAGCQANERTGHLGMVMLHYRHSAVNGGRHGEILIRDLPEQLDAGRRFGVGFGKSWNLSKAIEHQMQSLPSPGFPQILLDLRRAP